MSKKITKARKIENRINKLGFTLGCVVYPMVYIDKPVMKKCINLLQYDTVDKALEDLEKWIKSDDNPRKGLIPEELK